MLTLSKGYATRKVRGYLWPHKIKYGHEYS